MKIIIKEVPNFAKQTGGLTDLELEDLEYQTGGKNVIHNGKPMYQRKDGKIVKRGLWSNVYLSKKQQGGKIDAKDALGRTYSKNSDGTYTLNGSNKKFNYDQNLKKFKYLPSLDEQLAPIRLENKKLIEEQIGDDRLNPLLNQLDDTIKESKADSFKNNLIKSYILYGKPNINIDPNINNYSHNNRASFSVDENKMNIGKNKVDDYFSELAHAKQGNIYGLTSQKIYNEIKKNNPKALKDKIFYDQTEYNREGSSEHQAHRIIEPEIRSIFLDLKNRKKIDSIMQVPEHNKFFKKVEPIKTKSNLVEIPYFLNEDELDLEKLKEQSKRINKYKTYNEDKKWYEKDIRGLLPTRKIDLNNFSNKEIEELELPYFYNPENVSKQEQYQVANKIKKEKELNKNKEWYEKDLSSFLPTKKVKVLKQTGGRLQTFPTMDGSKPVALVNTPQGVKKVSMIDNRTVSMDDMYDKDSVQIQGNKAVIVKKNPLKKFIK